MTDGSTTQEQCQVRSEQAISVLVAKLKGVCYRLRAKRTLSLFLQQHFKQQAQSFQRIKTPNTQKDPSMRIQWSAAGKKRSIGTEA